MAKVTRTDVGTLRKPEKMPVTGYLRVDGFAAKVGVQEYYRADEKTGKLKLVRELRLPEDVFAPQSLAGYEGASFIDTHPRSEDGEPVNVTVDNVDKLEVGTVTGPGRQDGDHVAISTMIKKKNAIRKVEQGRTALSVGYAVDLDETPGVHPLYGRYDAIQRNIVVNHVALVDSARAGESARLRMDEGDVGAGTMMSGLKLTTIVEGHQHTIEPNESCVSWSVRDGDSVSHSHELIRNLDGSITMSENAGHTHGVIGTTTVNIDHGRDRMETAEQRAEMIRALNESLKTSEARADAAEKLAATEKLRADTAQGEMNVLRGDIETLKVKVASQVAATETEAFRAEKVRADEAEAKVSRFDEMLNARVLERSALMTDARIVMGDTFRMNDLSDRQIMAAVVTRCDSSADVSKDVADGVVIGQFKAHVKARIANARSQANISEIMSSQTRVDAVNADESLAARRKEYRDQWKKPLPNSRAAARKDS
jgi:hypothetical protein